MAVQLCCFFFKWIGVVINFCTTIAGWGVLSLSIKLLCNPVYRYSLPKDDPEGLLTIVIITTVLGTIMTVAGSIGCMGAYKENNLLIKFFLSFLMIIVALEIVIGVMAYNYSTQLRKDVRAKIQQSFDDPSTADSIQRELKCCGIDGPDSWANIPTSCCDPSVTQFNNLTSIDPKEDALLINDDEDVCTVYHQGCEAKLEQNSRDILKLTVTGLITVGIIEVVTIIVTIFLCCAIRNSDF